MIDIIIFGFALLTVSVLGLIIIGEVLLFKTEQKQIKRYQNLPPPPATDDYIT